MNSIQCKLLVFITEEVLPTIPKDSSYREEEWFVDWVNLVFGWHFEHYKNAYSFDNYTDQLDTVLTLSEHTWESPNFVDEFEQWKECLEESDDPDKFTTYPIYLCKKYIEYRGEYFLTSKILCEYLEEKITLL
jgi:hypothetical protein